MSVEDKKIAKCPTCEQILKFAPEKAGSVANCPKCGTKMRLPGTPPTRTAPVATVVSAPPALLPHTSVPIPTGVPQRYPSTNLSSPLPSRQSTVAKSPPVYPTPPRHAAAYSVPHHANHYTYPYQAVDQFGVPLKSKVAAGLLGIFLGGYGAHNFYLGKTGLAVTQLMMTILGICLIPCFGLGGLLLLPVGIWALVESIMCFTGSMTDANGRPLI